MNDSFRYGLLCIWSRFLETRPHCANVSMFLKFSVDLVECIGFRLYDQNAKEFVRRIRD
jgi:hypothetical protein